MEHNWEPIHNEDGHAMKCSICGEVIDFCDRDYWEAEINAECKGKIKKQDENKQVLVKGK
jgi:Fe2+ or Zn2+ uptake regulation protein